MSHLFGGFGKTGREGASVLSPQACGTVLISQVLATQLDQALLSHRPQLYCWGMITLGCYLTYEVGSDPSPVVGWPMNQRLAAGMSLRGSPLDGLEDRVPLQITDVLTDSGAQAVPG